MQKFAIGLLIGIALATVGHTKEIEFLNGDKIDAKVVEQNEKEIVVEHPQLGRLVIPRSALKPPVKPNPGLFGTQFLKGWKRNLGLGMSGSSGNSTDASFNASLATSRSAKTFRGNFTSAFFFASQDSQTTTNEFFADYQHNFLLTDSKFFIFAQGRYQYDQFQAWLHRISSSVGVGYDFVKNSKLKVSGDFGAGFSRTWGTERQWRPEGVLGLKLSWKPLKGHEFLADSTYFPDFDDLPEFRVLSNATYSVAIAGLKGLGVMVGLKNEYDSRQPDRNNNLKYFGNLVYDF
ncbi:DUF481 domain-containing protein [Myxococcota bacterium]|nr:DUF481 domain-containing protein [Myxococcota bacterium]